MCLTTITFLHHGMKILNLVLMVKHTFPGGYILMREMRMYGSIHEHCKISGHKPFSFFSYMLQVKVSELVYITVQFIFYYIIQNFTSLFLKKKHKIQISNFCSAVNFSTYTLRTIRLVTESRLVTVCRWSGGGTDCKGALGNFWE